MLAHKQLHLWHLQGFSMSHNNIVKLLGRPNDIDDMDFNTLDSWGLLNAHFLRCETCKNVEPTCNFCPLLFARTSSSSSSLEGSPFYMWPSHKFPPRPCKNGCDWKISEMPSVSGSLPKSSPRHFCRNCLQKSKAKPGDKLMGHIKSIHIYSLYSETSGRDQVRNRGMKLQHDHECMSKAFSDWLKYVQKLSPTQSCKQCGKTDFIHLVQGILVSVQLRLFGWESLRLRLAKANSNHRMLYFLLMSC